MTQCFIYKMFFGVAPGLCVLVCNETAFKQPWIGTIDTEYALPIISYYTFIIYLFFHLGIIFIMRKLSLKEVFKKIPPFKLYQ